MKLFITGAAGLAIVLAAAIGVTPPRPIPQWVAKLGGSIGELMARSLRMSNRKLRQASVWAPRWPSLREGWPAMLQAASADATPASGRQGSTLGGSQGM